MIRSRSSGSRRPSSGVTPTDSSPSPSSGTSRPMASRISWPSTGGSVVSSMTWAPSAPSPARTRVAREPSRRVDAVRLQDLAEQCRDERGWSSIVDPVARMDQGDRHAIAGVDLRQLHAGRTRTEDRRGSAATSRVEVPSHVRPRVRLGEPWQVAERGSSMPTARITAPASRTLVAHADSARAVERSRAANDGRAGALEALHVAGVVRGRLGPSRLIM